MKRLVWVFWVIPLSGFCQFEHALLWKVSAAGSTHTSYLFGTMHTNDTLANTFSDTWWSAFGSCNVVASEVNMMEITDPALILQHALMKDTLLSDLYSEQDYALIRTLITREFDESLVAMLERMKPFHVLALIQEKPEDGASFDAVMDVRIQALALKQGKKILGLETPEEQAKSIDVLSLREQAMLLLDYAKTEDFADEFYDKLKSFYLAQNLDSLGKVQMAPYFPEKLIDELVAARNRRFLKSLINSMTENDVFCMVGAMHLTGEDGLIAALRKEGYSVEPVNFYFGQAPVPSKK